MALKTVDARGRACPEPVLLTRKALETSPEGVQVLVSSSVSRDNVRRFAASRGYQIEVQRSGEDFLLIITR